MPVIQENDAFKALAPSRPIFRELSALAALALLTAGSALAQENPAERELGIETITLFDYDSPGPPWDNIDDAVMGGVSTSEMRIEEGIAVFEGMLSLENNGGFASVRSKSLQNSLEGCEGIRLRVKGDGKNYQLRIRTSPAFDGPSYQRSFETTEGQWTEVDLPFADFAAAYRGRQLPNQPKLNPADIRTLGFLIADKQAGPFALQVDWIHAWRANATPLVSKSEGGE